MMTKMIINADISDGKIDKNIYGHFSEHLGRCIYEGIWVGKDSPIPNTEGIRNDVLEALKEMKIPVLRWPGGCFADEYHWKDGIGPLESRKKMINTHWGGMVEDNSFGTHEFMRLCELLETEPYICGNVGSGTVQEMQEWVEYMTFDGESPMANSRKANGQEKPWKLTYFGVGNENWGCGGRMRPEFYADQYRRYSTYVRNFSGNKVFKIACGPNNDDYNWTETVMKNAARFMDGLSLHYYTIPNGFGPPPKGSSTCFDESEWFITLKKTLYMDELISKHGTIMDRYDPQKRVALIVDEWGTWYDAEPGTNPRFLYQQNTLRDALVAAVNLNIFHKYCDRVKMANIAQMVNVLQAVILTEGDKMILTPTYHVFNMFKVHQDSKHLPLEFKAPLYQFSSEAIPAVSASASIDSEGVIHISMCNLNPNEPIDIMCEIRGALPASLQGTILTACEMNTHNTFNEPDKIKPEKFNGAKLENNSLKVALPPKSVVLLSLDSII